MIGLRRDLFDHLTGLSLRYFSQQKAGWIIARLTSDVDAVSDTLSQGMPTLVSNVILLPAAVAALLIADWRLGLDLVRCPTAGAHHLALVPAGLARRERRAAQPDRRGHGADRRVGSGHGRRAGVQPRAPLPGRVRRAERREPRAGDVRPEDLLDLLPLDRVPRRARDGAVLYFGSRLYQHDTLTIGTLITAIYLLQLVFQPLQELSDVYGQLQSASAAMVKIASILDEESEIQDKPGAKPLPRIDGDLDLDSVVFAYGKDPVLQGVSFHMGPGSCFALVGESGHGKSTLAKLIGRHYDPDQGAVRVDGHDLRDVELRSYRRQLGVVLQDPFLFSGTIASNIRFAKPDATDEEVEAAAAAVGVDRVAARVSGGLDHEVREGGAGLSSGERQLISIARALLADPRILVLDEATSNIDRPTEVLIERALDRLLKGRTSIIIAHRLSTVRRADEILVVENGQIVQRGSERELLTAGRPVPPARPHARGRRARARSGAG